MKSKVKEVWFRKGQPVYIELGYALEPDCENKIKEIQKLVDEHNKKDALKYYNNLINDVIFYFIKQNSQIYIDDKEYDEYANTVIERFNTEKVKYSKLKLFKTAFDELCNEAIYEYFLDEYGLKIDDQYFDAKFQEMELMDEIPLNELPIEDNKEIIRESIQREHVYEFIREFFDFHFKINRLDKVGRTEENYTRKPN